MKNQDLIQILSDALEKLKDIDPKTNVEIIDLATASIGAVTYEQRMPSKRIGFNIKTYKKPNDAVQIELVSQAWIP